MPRGIPHDDTVRAAAIADLLLGCTLSEVARKHHVDRKTVRGWKDAYPGGLPVAERIAVPEVSPVSPGVPHQKKDGLGALVFDYLAAGLETLAAQARVTGDPEWIKKQPAGELAILHGVLADKIVRVLAALESPDDDSLTTDR